MRSKIGYWKSFPKRRDLNLITWVYFVPVTITNLNLISRFGKNLEDVKSTVYQKASLERTFSCPLHCRISSLLIPRLFIDKIYRKVPNSDSRDLKTCLFKTKVLAHKLERNVWNSGPLQNVKVNSSFISMEVTMPLKMSLGISRWRHMILIQV